MNKSAEFLRCVDFLVRMMEKYGDRLDEIIKEEAENNDVSGEKCKNTSAHSTDETAA